MYFKLNKFYKIQAKDADIGLNSAVRYELLSRGDDSHTKFYIDPISGDIRSMVTFNLDGGKMYGFDVKATDCEGSESGNSATTTVYVRIILSFIILIISIYIFIRFTFYRKPK